MARQLDNEPFRCFSNASAEFRFDNRESMRHMHIANTPQPPSWADVEVMNVNMNVNTSQIGRQQHNQWNAPQNQWNAPQNQWNAPQNQWNAPQNQWNAPPNYRYQYQRQQPQPYIQQWQQPAENDVFSGMGHWGGNPNAAPAQTVYQKSHQYGRNGKQFNEPSPLPPSGDVFSNIETWNANKNFEKDPSPNETMTIDLLAPTPPPTFQPYPMKNQSLASPTASSLTSSDLQETNSWTCLAILLQEQPSRSPSIASGGTKSPTENTNGHWISNLH